MLRNTIIAMLIASGAVAGEKSIDKQHVRKVIDEYEQAMKLNEWGIAPQKLYCDKSAQSFSQREARFTERGNLGRGVSQVTLRKLKGLNALVDISYLSREFDMGNGKTEQRTPHDHEGYIQFTPDGKIKYDPIFVRHPLEIANPATINLVKTYEEHVERLRNRKRNASEENSLKNARNDWERYLETLTQSGVPLFGLTREKPAEEQRDNLEQLIEWLSSEAESWDVDEPLTPLPKEKYDRIEGWTKRVRLAKAG